MRRKEAEEENRDKRFNAKMDTLFVIIYITLYENDHNLEAGSVLKKYIENQKVNQAPEEKIRKYISRIKEE